VETCAYIAEETIFFIYSAPVDSSGDKYTRC